MESRIKRAGFDLQEFTRISANGLSDAMTVASAPLESIQDEHIERALQELNAIAIGFVPGHACRQSTTKSTRMSTGTKRESGGRWARRWAEDPAEPANNPMEDN